MTLLTISNDDNKSASAATQPSASVCLAPHIDDTSNLDVYSLTEEEGAALAAFSDQLGRDDVLPGKLVRFLRARNLDLDATTSFLESHLEWHAKMLPEAIDEKDVAETALSSNFINYRGNSTDGSPVLEFHVGSWNPHQYSKDQFCAYLCWHFANVERYMSLATPTKHSQGLIVVDLRGWAFWMAGYLGYLKAAIDITQNQCPERLRHVYIYGAPAIFQAAWKIIKPCIDQRTVSKFEFLDSAEVLREKLEAATVDPARISMLLSA